MQDNLWEMLYVLVHLLRPNYIQPHVCAITAREVCGGAGLFAPGPRVEITGVEVDSSLSLYSRLMPWLSSRLAAGAY